MANTDGDVSLLLAKMRGGDENALAKLMPLVYAELRRLAGHYLRGERTDHTLQPTALVHEAFLRLAGTAGASFGPASESQPGRMITAGNVNREAT